MTTSSSHFEAAASSVFDVIVAGAGPVDALHPNAKGYQIWADAILPTVKEMMSAK